MKGSEKQVAWAKSLTKKMNEKFEDMLTECKQLYPDDYEKCNLILNSIKSAFEEAHAGEVIDLLKDRKEIDGKEYYNALYHAIFGSSSSLAEKVKKIIPNGVCKTKSATEQEKDFVKIDKLQNEEYAKEHGIELFIGSKYTFQKGTKKTKDGAYSLYFDGKQVKEMAVPIAYGCDGSDRRCVVFKITDIDKPVAFMQD